MVATRPSPSSAPPAIADRQAPVDDVVVVPDPPRRWGTVVWFVVLATIAALSIWSARTTSFGSRPGAGAASGADGCPLVDGVAPSRSVGGRALGTFRADATGSCVSGVEPTIAVSVADAAPAPALPGVALAGAGSFELGPAPHPTLQVEVLRASSSSAVADVVRVGDGVRVVSVATTWSSVDPTDGTGPGRPDVDGAVALAEVLLGA